MEQEDNKEAMNPAKASTKLQSNQNKNTKLLKARSKIAKKSVINSLKAKKAQGTTQVGRRNRTNKNKIVLEGNKASSSNQQEDPKKPNSREENQQINAANEERIEKIQQIQKDEVKIGGSDKNEQNQRREEKRGESDKSLRNQKNKEKGQQDEKEKLHGLDKNEQKQKSEEKRAGSDKSLRNQKNKEKQGRFERSRQDEEKKEKLGGLIFMCSAKTKPDCFRYRVMGVSASKKDLVLGVKPGLKLFLYDFDLKLMYGIYKASSSGGMKLEPKAFGGSFPVQVRFNVHTDCYPLPESIFNKAIKENYNEKHKFKTELTVKQVRRLTDLFRPVAVHLTAPPIRSPPRSMHQDRKVYEGVRESRPHSGRETFARDPYATVDATIHPVLSHEKDRHVAYQEVASLHREVPRGLYLSEKEYRAHGLLGERNNFTPPYLVTPTLDHYHNLLRHPDPIYRDRVPAARESIRADPLSLSEREYLPYHIGARRELPSPFPPSAVNASVASASALESFAREPYYTPYYSASTVDSYLPPPRRERETYPVETDHLLRRETDQADRLYYTHAADALSNYNQIQHYQGAKPEAAPAPVSSRYSFAGPSLSYR